MFYGLLLKKNQGTETRFASGMIGGLLIYWNKPSLVSTLPLVLGEDNFILTPDSSSRDGSEHFTESPVVLQVKGKVNMKFRHSASR